MVWRAEDPQGNEAAKIRAFIVPYTRGRGLDLGCGPFKAFPHFIGYDNLHHARAFGWEVAPGTIHGEAADLSMFADGSLNFIFSSHLLEHIEDHVAALKQWWRKIAVGGHLVLYLPHADLYPRKGQKGANPDHKHDFLPGDIVQTMRGMPEGWDLVENEDRAERAEYSFFQVYRKRADLQFNEVPWQRNPGGQKRALVVRFGGIGDMLIASSILPGLKAQGYHVTLMTTPNGQAVVAHDPNIDDWWIQDPDQVPNPELGTYWHHIQTRFDRFINLSESLEVQLLPEPGRVAHSWPHDVRHRLLNVNYLERAHDIAGVPPHDFAQRFYPSEAEQVWAASARREMGGGFIVLWALAGSSIHKAYPWVDRAVTWLLKHSDCKIVFTGGQEETKLVEGVAGGFLNDAGYGWDALEQINAAKGLPGLLSLMTSRLGSKRAFATTGLWGVRQSLAFAVQADCVVGPETGVLNAVAMEPMPKIVMLSHSSVENLTKHWTNTLSLEAEGVACRPCHRLHYGDQFCSIGKTRAALCAEGIDPRLIVDAVLGFMKAREAA